MVFRLSHNGQVSADMKPDMSRVRWSPAQHEQPSRIAEASACYVQMSIERKGNKRPYDMAVSDYLKGINLLGDRFHLNRHWWEAKRQSSRRKKRSPWRTHPTARPA